MRVISVFVAASALAVLSQPAAAVCVNRGGAATCVKDSSFRNYEPMPATGTPVDDPGTSGKTIVLQPAGSGDDAWVLIPESAEGAVVLSSANANAAVSLCGSGVIC